MLGTVAETAVDVVTLPVKAVSAGVDAATTSQSEADRKRGGQIREDEERRGREARLMLERCRKGRALPAEHLSASHTEMRYYLDTEFNGFNGALLSIALVPEDGDEFYITLACAEPVLPWVEHNVMPFLDHVPVGLVAPRDRAAARRRTRSRPIWPRTRSPS